MLLAPYFEIEIESSKTTSELKELLNAYSGQKSELVDGLEISGNGMNRFIVHNEHLKFLEVHGTITERGDYANIELRFGLRLFTIIFQLVVLGLLLIRVLTETEHQAVWILFFLGVYLVNLIGFRATANSLKRRLTRILK